MAADVGVALPSYRRSALQSITYRDADGESFKYGKQYWTENFEPPPDNAYSHVSHPERFDPLCAVAEELFQALVKDYRATIEVVDLDSDPDYANIVERFGDRYFSYCAILLHPREAPDAAPIMIVWERYHGSKPDIPRTLIRLYAGALFRSNYPNCGCDACDESLEDISANLEQTISELLTGGLRERLAKNPDQDGGGSCSQVPDPVNWASFSLGWSSESSCSMRPWSQRNAARLIALENGIWKPWVKRH